jgi:peptidoglycan/LPS O-acetylase OafA/YrhL
MNIKEKNYYPYFDYLRIILSSVVMFAHAGIISWPNSGRLAVDIFFALSGWLIGGILLSTERTQLPRFFFNRAIRIWIPYYIALTLIIIASLLKDPLNIKWLEFIIYKATWVYNIFGPPQLANFHEQMPLDGTANHFWSVNAEEQFYLLAPLALVVFANQGRKISTWLLIVATLWFMNIYAPIAIGVLASIINKEIPNFYAAKNARRTLMVTLIITGSGLALNQNYTLFAPIFSICLVLFLAIKGTKKPLGSFLGGISYPLYLNHWIGVFFMNFVLAPFGLRDSGISDSLAAIMNYGIAAFLYWFIERRALKLRAKFYSPKAGIVFTCIAFATIVIGLAIGFALNSSYAIATALTIFTLTATITLLHALKPTPHTQALP